MGRNKVRKRKGSRNKHKQEEKCVKYKKWRRGGDKERKR